MLRGYEGGDLAGKNPQVRHVACPYTGDRIATVPALRPDVTILHAQAADRRGNVLIQGIVGAQKEAALAASRLLVTVEEVVDEFDAQMNAIVLPHFAVTGIACVPGGAWPSYAQGYYARDNGFYQAWDAIARDRDAFNEWIERHVRKTRDHAGFLHSLAEAA
jgi:glutaconate CoA-transferase subunit A